VRKKTSQGPSKRKAFTCNKEVSVARHKYVVDDEVEGREGRGGEKKKEVDLTKRRNNIAAPKGLENATGKRKAEQQERRTTHNIGGAGE